RYLRSFVAPESLFIDIMMNVPIIFYAARATGDRSLYEIATAHCRTTERTLVRPDGGTAHEGIFDLETGAFLRQTTHQGLRGAAAWRGRATAMARSTPTPMIRPTWRSRSGTPTTSSRVVRRTWSLPGTSTFRPVPTEWTTARPRRSPRRACGTLPS